MDTNVIPDILLDEISDNVEMHTIAAQTIDEMLNGITYDAANDSGYVPSDFALEFINFIKLVNGAAGEENLTPVLHFKMLDQISGMKQNIANMLFRGSAKTTLLAEYLFLYLGVYGKLPGFGKIDLALYVSDSIENGVKNMRKNLEFRWENSEFLQQYIPVKKFTDIRWEFINAEGNQFIVKGYGAKALSLDSILYTDTGTTTIGECLVGDKIFGADGKLTTITHKSEIFHKPMYNLNLVDGRSIKVSEDHINSVVVNTDPNNTARWVEQDLTTKELLQLPLLHTKLGNKNHRGTSSKSLIHIKNCKPVQFSTKDLPVDPYTLGLLIGDGSMKKDGSNVLHAHKDDIPFYKRHIPYTFGTEYVDKRNSNVVSLTIKNLSSVIKGLKLSVHGNYKFIPEVYKRASITQRQALLQGLMDTDGTISDRKVSPVSSFCSNSEQLVNDVCDLVRSLGGTASIGRTGIAYRAQVKLNMHVFKLPRKADKEKHSKKVTVAIQSITPIDVEPSQCIAVDNQERQFITTGYTRTHNTGVRGTKELGQRPKLAVLDDLISDEDARSDTVIASVEDTVYKAIDYALHPTKFKIIWSGTPFNARDPLYKAVESGAWHVNVFPVCEEFPCKRTDFKGAWEDRFTYDAVLAKYLKALRAGKVDTFNQELMLRIISEEERIIQDNDIVWYERENVLKNKHQFNFYITTDFATSDKAYNDFSVISVWAYSSAGDWMYVDGVCKKQLMDQNVKDLFKYVQMYKPQSVGIEVSGQQGGFIQWIQNEMINKNMFFNLASDGNKSSPGIRPLTRKLERFNVMVPMFKSHKVWFPTSLKETAALAECMTELTLVTRKGFKSKHDDFADTISMLAVMEPWKPSEDTPKLHNGVNNEMWADDDEDEVRTLDSYIV